MLPIPEMFINSEKLIAPRGSSSVLLPLIITISTDCFANSAAASTVLYVSARVKIIFGLLEISCRDISSKLIIVYISTLNRT